MPKKTKRPTAKRKYQAKFKPETKLVSENELAPPTAPPEPAASASAIATRLIKHVGATGLPATAVKYEVACGAARPVAKATAGDIVAIDELKKSFAAEVRDYAGRSPTRIGLQLSRLCVRTARQ